MKKALALILSLVLILSCVPVGFSVYGADTTCGLNAQYELDERTGLVTISGTGAIFGNESSPFTNNSSVRNIVVNSGITEIGENAFAGCTNLKTVQLPNTLTHISDSAFKDCSRLRNINLPESLTTIGNNAFENCAELLSVTVPNNALILGVGVFKNCINLKSVVLPDGITSIKKDFFSGCQFLSEIIIPNTVELIDNNAFYYCSRLVSINIPVSVSRINESAFYCCDNLVNVFYQGFNFEWESITVFDNNEKLTSGVIHYGIEVSDIDSHIITTTVKNPTCESNGSADVVCACNLQYSQIIPALGHRYDIQTVDSTCTEQGYTFYDCVGCDTAYYDDWIPALGHSFVDGLCERCGADYTCRHEHTHLLYQADPTCEDEGYSGDLYCNDCNVLLEKGDIIPCHYLTKEFIKTVVPSGCGKSGHTVYRCTECSSIFEADYTYKDHSKQLISVVEPTCEGQSYSEYYCSDCNTTFKENIINALGHNYVNGVCSNCGEEPEILELDTYYDTVISESTKIVYYKFVPQWDGYYYFYSDSQLDTQGAIYDCDMEMLDSNDDYYDLNFVIEYELYADEVYYFSAELVEGEGSFEVILSEEFIDNHCSEVVESIEPTCVEYGYNIYRCSICDSEYTADFTDPTGHHFENGICVYCHNLQEDCIESDHYYDNNSDISWTINKPGAKTIEITFSGNTFVEADYDFIYIYDKNNNEVGCYTGDMLMDKTVVVYSEKAIIRLISDESTNNYGFAVKNIKAYYEDFALRESSAAVIQNGFIYGLVPGLTTQDLIDNHFVVSNQIKVEFSKEIIGTGTEISIIDKQTNAVKTVYTIVIFGDVNGDGYYDATDSIIVDCISNGILTPSTAQSIAADCNKDGTIDSSDVQLLQSAGLLLSEISQNRDENQLSESSVYEEYISLIDQSPIAEKDEQNTVQENNNTESIINMILYYLKIVILFIIKLF